jgi:serine/threonine protein kinase
MINSRYEVTELLGKGGYGQVWHAFDTLTSQEVALKFVSAHTIYK